MQADIFRDIIVPVIGGLGIFMLGLEFMSNGIQALAVNKMRALLAKVAGTPITGLLAGTFITGVIQSSTAMTVMVGRPGQCRRHGPASRDQRDHGRQYRHHAGQRPDRAAARTAGAAPRRVLRADLRVRQEREDQEYRARLHGLRADLLRPQPDDRRPAPAARHAGSHVGDHEPQGRQLSQPDLLHADRRVHHRDDPFVVGDDRHRHGARRGRRARLANGGRVLAGRRSRHHHHLVDGVAGICRRTPNAPPTRTSRSTSSALP